jgi:hypothetical protein
VNASLRVNRATIALTYAVSRRTELKTRKERHGEADTNKETKPRGQRREG